MKMSDSALLETGLQSVASQLFSFYFVRPRGLRKEKKAPPCQYKGACKIRARWKWNGKFFSYVAERISFENHQSLALRKRFGDGAVFSQTT